MRPRLARVPNIAHGAAMAAAAAISTAGYAVFAAPHFLQGSPEEIPRTYLCLGLYWNALAATSPFLAWALLGRRTRWAHLPAAAWWALLAAWLHAAGDDADAPVLPRLLPC